MEICWDNIENLRYNKKTGRWYKETGKITPKGKKVVMVYLYSEKCDRCGHPFLRLHRPPRISKFCSKECSSSGKNNGMYGKTGKKHPMYGKHHTKETRKKMSEAQKGEKSHMYGKKGKDSPTYGRHHTEEWKKKMSIRVSGKNHPSWKGGVIKKNIPMYDTYAQQIELCDIVRRNNEDRNILEVKCAYCGKWYIPTLVSVKNRIQSLNSYNQGEQRLFCSEECKKECPIYRQYLYPKGFKINTSREVQPELRQMVFELDNHKCQRCGSTKQLHCHHLTGIEVNPIESADVDNCITFCKKCHKWIHKQKGCRPIDLRREKCEEI